MFIAVKKAKANRSKFLCLLFFLLAILCNQRDVVRDELTEPGLNTGQQNMCKTFACSIKKKQLINFGQGAKICKVS